MPTLAIAFLTLVALEPVMAIVHRLLFHGPLWCSHESHHRHPTARRIVRNDLLWAWPIAAASLLVALGDPVLAGIGIGTLAYVAAYVVAHDGVAHGRFRVPRTVRRLPALRDVARTHRLHHRGGRDGGGAPPFAVFAAGLEQRWLPRSGYVPPADPCFPVAAPSRSAR